VVEAVEGAAALDGPASAVGALARDALSPPPIKHLLRGDWLGHALHPALSDIVVGTLLSASLLDVLGGDDDRRARHRLILAALAAATPTALTGVSDWAEEESSDDGIRRAGIVHAASNSTALGLYTASMAAGRRRAVALRLAGAAALGAGAYLGGHLSFVKGSGVEAAR
jgi:hypothetical protein